MGKYGDEELDELDRIVTENWGSEDQALEDFDRLAKKYNRDLFDDHLPEVVVTIAPRWILSGPMGTDTDAGATYEPSSSGQFYIHLGQMAIRSKESAAVVLAHEMIHHWEYTMATDSESEEYPLWIDELISQSYRDAKRERHWRSGHSKRFTAKANLVATKIGVHLRTLLYSRTSTSSAKS